MLGTISKVDMAPLSSFCKQVHFLIFCCKLYFPSFIAKWLLARFRQWETLEESNRAGRRGEAMVFLMMSPSPVLRSGYISSVSCFLPDSFYHEFSSY